MSSTSVLFRASEETSTEVVMETQEKRLFLIFNGRFPSEKAAALFTARNAEAFKRTGYEVVVIVPKRKEVRDTAYEAYGLSKVIPVVYVPVLNLFGLPIPLSFSYWILTFSFSVSTLKYLRLHAKASDIIYSNESFPLLLVSFRFPRTVYEMHDFPESKKALFGWFLRRIKKVLIHNQWKTDQAIKLFRIDRSCILTESNAVDTEVFNPPETKLDARIKLGLLEDGVIIVYTGHLYGWKGVDTLVQAVTALPEANCFVVGGTPEDVELYKKRYSALNVHWVGYTPSSEIPLWQRAADVVVLPNTAKEAISAYYTSPMKLFEYLASGTPVVASRIPSVEEIVSDDMVEFAEADNPEDFTRAIRSVLEHPEAANSRSLRGQAEMKDHTWDARAKRIVTFIEQ